MQRTGLDWSVWSDSQNAAAFSSMVLTAGCESCSRQRLFWRHFEASRAGFRGMRWRAGGGEREHITWLMLLPFGME